jgi:Kef-type K+ transport system membrane component KefB
MTRFASVLQLRFLLRLLALFIVVGPTSALASTGAADHTHTDPVASVALSLAVVLLAARFGGEFAVRLKQPEVLGELVVGVVLGNLTLVGVSTFEPLKSDPTLDMLSRLGVLLLLFEVGLESTVRQMMRVGASSLLVALLGIGAPFGLGWAVGAWLLPDAGPFAHAFLGATLCATSVGITARVLKDINRSQSIEARIILGAAVIDDVLGLVILAVVSGAIVASAEGRAVSGMEIGWIFGQAALFLVGSLVIGVYAAPKVFRAASKLRGRGVLLALGLSFCFFLSWLANRIGLAPIVGAFAAGLILEQLHFKDFVDRGEHGLEELIHPISSFLVPIFFVMMGMRTDLRSFAQPGVLGVAGALTVAAIIGKQACSLGVLTKGADKLSIGLGMIPRGEVGLIFASIGQSLTIGSKPVIDDALFSAVVVMVIVTTMVTPPVLKWSMGRHRQTSPG